VSAASPARRIRRGVVNDFVDRHLLIWEVTMGCLATGYLVAGVLIDGGTNVPLWTLTALGVVFLTEFVIRFIDSTSRLAYLRWHWLDLVSCIPLIGGTRSFRLLRLLRLGAAARVVNLAEAHAVLRQRGRNSAWFIVPFLLVAWFIAASAYWELEHGLDPAIRSFGDALYWTFLTTVTVGYGAETHPVTAEGRILAGVLIFTGIGLIGFLSSRLTARLLDVHDDHHEKHTQRLVTLEDHLANIEALLGEVVANQRSGASSGVRGRSATPEQKLRKR